MPDTNYKDYIDALSADTAPESTDLIYIRTSAGSRKMTVQDLFKAPSLMAVDWFRDGGDIGGYLMDGVDDYITVADDTKLDLGTDDFSLELFVRLPDYTPAAEMVLIEKHASNLGYKLLLTTAGKLKLQFGNGSDFTTYSYESAVVGVSDDTWAHFLVTADRSGNALFYVNGILNATVDISASVAQTLDNAGALNIFGNGTSYTAGRIAIVRAYNIILTATETANSYNNGRPDLYEYENKYRNGSQIDLANGWDFTSGWTADGATIDSATQFTTTGGNNRIFFAAGYSGMANKIVKIVAAGTVSTGTLQFRTGDSTVNPTVSGTFDTTVFMTNGVNEILQLKGSMSGQVISITKLKITLIGVFSEYNHRNAGALGWIDSSGSQMSGSTSGNPVSLTKFIRPSYYRDVRKAIAANTNTTLTSIVPRGYKIVSIRAKGSDSLTAVKIGTSSAGEQIVASTTTSGTTPKLLTLASTANDAYSESADVTLYARHDTSASGKTMDLIFHFEKIGN